MELIAYIHFDILNYLKNIIVNNILITFKNNHNEEYENVIK